MHNSLSFPLECIYRQDVPYCLKWDNDYLIGISLSTKQHDPFKNPDIMQSFLLQAKKTKHEPKKERVAFTNWTTQYGFLAPEGPFPSISTLEDSRNLEAMGMILPINKTVNLFKESIFSFWKEARRLVLLWDMFEAVSNRNIETLKELIVIENTGIQEPSPLNNDATKFRGKVERFSFTMDFSASPEEIGKNQLSVYQHLGFACVISEVEKHLTHLTISSNAINLNPIAFRDRDIFNFKTHIRPKNLLQAFYLQFYILLNGIPNKVCPNCWKPFSPPKREDQIYCSTKCKGTAKKNRQRQEHPELILKDLLYEDMKYSRLREADRKKIESAFETNGLDYAKILRKEIINKKKAGT